MIQIQAQKSNRKGIPLLHIQVQNYKTPTKSTPTNILFGHGSRNRGRGEDTTTPTTWNLPAPNKVDARNRFIDYNSQGALNNIQVDCD